MKKRGNKRRGIKNKNLNFIAIFVVIVLFLVVLFVGVIPRIIEKDGGLSARKPWSSNSECNDGKDNDGDGKCDYSGCYIGRGKNKVWLSFDPDCTSSTDNSEACTPSPEICDGKDNDCNPSTPDGSGDPALGTACDGSDSDLCKEGLYQCQSGSLRCSDSTGNNVEICGDMIDNNCNGIIDEGCGPVTNWPMFKQNLRHTGYIDSNAPNTNNLLWKLFINATKVGNAAQSSPVIEDGVIYIGRANLVEGATKGVIAINATTQEIIWDYITGMQNIDGVISTPAVAYDRIYFGSMNSFVYALNKANGELIWKYNATNLIIGSPTVYDNKVYIASFDKNLYALNATTNNPNGQLIWKTQIGEMPHSTPAIADDRVCVGSGSPGWGFGFGKNITCLNAQNGVIIWQRDIGGGIYASPAIVDGTLYFNSDTGYVYAFNVATGNQIWMYNIGPNGASPSVAFGRVFTLNDMSVEKTVYGKRYVYALNAMDGSLIWRYDITKISPINNQSNNPESSPAVSADGKVCLGVDGKGDFWAEGAYQNGSIICLNALTNNPNGELIWEYKVGEGIYVDSSPAIVNGIMYIKASDGYLYAFE